MRDGQCHHNVLDRLTSVLKHSTVQLRKGIFRTDRHLRTARSKKEMVTSSQTSFFKDSVISITAFSAFSQFATFKEISNACTSNVDDLNLNWSNQEI